MATLGDLKERPYLGKEDCDPPMKLTIAAQERKNLARDGEKPDWKIICSFKENVKPFACNITNFERIAQITGEGNSENWIGHVITLFHDASVMMGNEKKGGIRVYVPQPDMVNVVAPPVTPFNPEVPDEVPY